MKILEFFHKVNQKESTNKTKKFREYESILSNLLLRCIDFVSNLCEYIGKEMLNAEPSKHLASILKFSLKMKNIQIKMFVYSAIGEIAKTCPELVQGDVQEFFVDMVDSLQVFPQSLDPQFIHLSLCK